jgi:TRAP-type C4-dicarboxylate transport system permease small subunit
MAHGLVDRFMLAIEMTAAGFLAVVTAITFTSVILRYLFSWQIPDSYDFSSLLLGVLIFWGIAGASYRGEHITVDLLWGVLPAPFRRIMDVFADMVTLACLVVFTWMTASKVLSTYRDNIQTFDLRLPVWIFHFAAWIGLAAAIALLAVRSARLVFGSRTISQASHIQSIE